MEEEHKTFLRQNRIELLKAFYDNQQLFHFVCDELYRKNILNAFMLDDIRSISSTNGKIRHMLDIIPKTGPTAFSIFQKAYEEYSGRKLLKNNTMQRIQPISATRSNEIPRLVNNQREGNRRSSPPSTGNIEIMESVNIQRERRSSPPPPYPPPSYDELFPPSSSEHTAISSPVQESVDNGDSIFDYKINEDDCTALAKLIGVDWKHLGLQLGLEGVTIDQIEMENKGNCLKTNQRMLEYWMRLPNCGLASQILEANQFVFAFDPIEAENYLLKRAK